MEPGLTFIADACKDSFEASENVVGILNDSMPMDLWMVTRKSGPDWIVLACNKNPYNIKPGDTFNWSDSVCSRMVEGLGPSVAPNVNEISSYKNAEIREIIDFECYIGVPLTNCYGELFGTVCALSRKRPVAPIIQFEDTARRAARLLSTLLILEAERDEQKRINRRLRSHGEIVPHTGWPRANQWDSIVHFEETCATLLGHEVGAVVIDLSETILLPNISDEIADLKGLVSELLRPVDVAVRYAENRIGIIVPEATGELVGSLGRSLADYCKGNLPSAKVGWALRDREHGLAWTVEQAASLA